jgi:hypothetical protein
MAATIVSKYGLFLEITRFTSPEELPNFRAKYDFCSLNQTKLPIKQAAAIPIPVAPLRKSVFTWGKRPGESYSKNRGIDY